VLELPAQERLRFEACPRMTPHAAAPTSKARALLGWEPRITLKEGAAQSLEFFRSKAAAAE